MAVALILLVVIVWFGVLAWFGFAVFGIVVIRLFAFDFPGMFVLVGLFARLFVVLGASWWAVWMLDCGLVADCFARLFCLINVDLWYSCWCGWFRFLFILLCGFSWLWLFGRLFIAIVGVCSLWLFAFAYYILVLGGFPACCCDCGFVLIVLLCVFLVI